MASTAVDGYRQGAEICQGDDASCKKKMALPQGLLRVEDVREVGFNRAAGFLWVEQKKKTQHTFKAIRETVSFAPEVTAVVESRKLKKITGVKVKELLLWLSVVEVYIDDDTAFGKITFKTGSGLADSFPVSAFELDA